MLDDVFEGRKRREGGREGRKGREGGREGRREGGTLACVLEEQTRQVELRVVGGRARQEWEGGIKGRFLSGTLREKP